MSNFTTNWALYDPLAPKKKVNCETETEFLPNDIIHKLKLIEKAFH